MNTLLTIDEVAFRFGSFELFPVRRLLSRQGRPVKVGSRALDLLVTLVERAGQVVTKDELMTRVWSNVIVEDTNLRVNICNLRRILGDDRLDDRYIMYVARRGYVFVAPLEYSQRPPTRREARAMSSSTDALTGLCMTTPRPAYENPTKTASGG